VIPSTWPFLIICAASIPWITRFVGTAVEPATEWVPVPPKPRSRATILRYGRQLVFPGRQLRTTRHGFRNDLLNGKVVARSEAIQPGIQCVLAAGFTFCNRRTPSQRTVLLFDDVTVRVTTSKLPSALAFASDRCQIIAWNEQRSELTFEITPKGKIGRHRSLCDPLSGLAPTGQGSRLIARRARRHSILARLSDETLRPQCAHQIDKTVHERGKWDTHRSAYILQLQEAEPA
jgi:hypothetical protein